MWGNVDPSSLCNFRLTGTDVTLSLRPLADTVKPLKFMNTPLVNIILPVLFDDTQPRKPRIRH